MKHDSTTRLTGDGTDIVIVVDRQHHQPNRD